MVTVCTHEYDAGRTAHMMSHEQAQEGQDDILLVQSANNNVIKNVKYLPMLTRFVNNPWFHTAMDALKLFLDIEHIETIWGASDIYWYFFNGKSIGGIVMAMFWIVNPYLGIVDVKPIPQSERYDHGYGVNM